jgi:hypothetical protein
MLEARPVETRKCPKCRVALQRWRSASRAAFSAAVHLLDDVTLMRVAAATARDQHGCCCHHYSGALFQWLCRQARWCSADEALAALPPWPPREPPAARAYLAAAAAARADDIATSFQCAFLAPMRDGAPAPGPPPAPWPPMAPHGGSSGGGGTAAFYHAPPPPQW